MILHILLKKITCRFKHVNVIFCLKMIFKAAETKIVIQKNFNSSNLDGDLFTLPDWNSFFDPHGPIYETSVIKFLHLCFHAVLFIFYF